MPTIRDCRDCGKYKYLERDGKCRDCLGETTADSDASNNVVHLKLNVLHTEFQNNISLLREILATIESHPQVALTADPSQRDADLKLRHDCVRVYDRGHRAEISYSKYSGSQADKTTDAVKTALDKAVDTYT